MFLTGIEPRWESWFFWKDASHFKTDADLVTAMDSAQDFTFTSRLSAGISYDQDHYDIITSFFSPCANLPRGGAQQLLRARKIKFKAGFFSVANHQNKAMITKPLGYSANKHLCLSREDFSLNLLDD